MEIRLKQNDVEAAVKAHLTRMGFDRPVSQMNFIAGRAGKGLTCEIEVTDPDTGDDTGTPTGPVNRGQAAPSTPDAPAETKAAPAKPKAKPGPKPKANPALTPEPAFDPETSAASDELEPDQEEAAPPFEPQSAANEPEQATPTPKGKSLFG